MKLGLVFPQPELGTIASAVREIGLAAEALGFDHLVGYDHVVGAYADRVPPLQGPYDDEDAFHDPLVMFAYLAGITTTLEFASGLLILPQRQTALVAQQCADIDLFSNGRLRLGVGVGWNHVEYETLGADFTTRGRRLDEQIPLLRRFWTEQLVSFQGEFDRVDRANINPRPSSLIPIWVGGFSDAAFRRGGALGDGFIFTGPVERCLDQLETVLAHHQSSERADRPFGAEYLARSDTPIAAAESIRRWFEGGGTHAAVVTLRNGLDSVEAHLAFAASTLDLLR